MNNSTSVSITIKETNESKTTQKQQKILVI